MEDRNGAAILLFIFGLIVCLLVWKLSRSIGLDFQTTFKICGSLVLIVGVTGIISFFSRGNIPFRLLLPISLVAMWVAIWPALEVWGMVGPRPLAEMSGWGYEPQIAWWAEWYTRWGVALGILVAGYGVPAYVDRH